MSYVLPLLAQLDGSPHQGGNCGCVATAHAIRWSTDGKLHPSPDTCRQALGGTWVGQRSTPKTDATSLADQQRAWDSFRDDARRKGLRLPPYEIHLVEPWDTVVDALSDGHAVVLQIDHRTINQRDSRISGFPTFNGLHVIVLTDLRRRKGKLQLLDYDGGFDGRNRSVPRGPQWIDGWILREAAQEKVRISLEAEGMPHAKAKARAEDHAVFAIIAKAERIVEPPEPEPTPTPEPEPPCADKLARLRAEHEETVHQLDLSSDRITALETLVGHMRSALTAGGDAGDAADAALDEMDELLSPPPDTGAVPTDGVGPEA